jgi:hypothetical protein
VRDSGHLSLFRARLVAPQVSTSQVPPRYVMTTRLRRRGPDLGPVPGTGRAIRRPRREPDDRDAAFMIAVAVRPTGVAAVGERDEAADPAFFDPDVPCCRRGRPRHRNMSGPAPSRNWQGRVFFRRE